MNYGIFFKNVRKQCGYTQKEVADKLSIHKLNVSHWENNISRPEYEKLVELAKLYDVSLYDLLYSVFLTRIDFGKTKIRLSGLLPLTKQENQLLSSFP